METAGMLLVTATPNGAETGSAVNVARGALIYLYSPPRQLAVVSLGPVYNVRAGKKPDVGGDGLVQARRHGPGIATENGRSSGGRCCRGGRQSTWPTCSSGISDRRSLRSCSTVAR
jgi:hypothetical protein